MDEPLGQEPLEDEAKREKVCRLIGAGGNAPAPANEEAAEVIKQEGCQLIDWDGDPIDRSPEDGGRTFASAIQGLGDFPVTLSPHCVPADCGSKLVGNPYGADNEEEALAARAAGNKYMAPGVQMVSQAQLSKAAKVIKDELPDALPEPPADKNFNKYLTLAIADRLATPPEVVIWQMDNDRARDTYWNWVSLAEYAVMKKEQPNTRYILINNEGKPVEMDGQPWLTFSHFGTKEAEDVAGEPIMPMMDPPIGQGEIPGAEPEAPMGPP
jgi:hypothetical protein